MPTRTPTHVHNYYYTISNFVTDLHGGLGVYYRTHMITVMFFYDWDLHSAYSHGGLNDIYEVLETVSRMKNLPGTDVSKKKKFPSPSTD